MNNLQQKLFDEFDRFEKFSQYITKQDAARIATKIVLEVAKEAWEDGVDNGAVQALEGIEPSFEDFKKEIL